MSKAVGEALQDSIEMVQGQQPQLRSGFDSNGSKQAKKDLGAMVTAAKKKSEEAAAKEKKAAQPIVAPKPASQSSSTTPIKKGQISSEEEEAKKDGKVLLSLTPKPG